MKIIVPPPLSEFLSVANATSNEAVAMSGPAFRLVNDVDDMIRTRLWADDIGLDPIPAALAINSYFSFLGAVRVALSGQYAAIFPLIRHSLECACYTYRMANDPTATDVWLHRHDGKKEGKACRKVFNSAVADVSQSVSREARATWPINL